MDDDQIEEADAEEEPPEGDSRGPTRVDAARLLDEADDDNNIIRAAEFARSRRCCWYE